MHSCEVFFYRKYQKDIVDFKEKCYSCSACAEACPTKAISFDENIHPEIDLQKCINCNRCERVCIELNKPEDIEELNCIEGYIVKNKNNEIRKVSSSGGVFLQYPNLFI